MDIPGRLKAGILKLFWLATPIFVFRNLATLQDLLRPSRWSYLVKLIEKNSQFDCLATLFWKLATLKRVATHSLRTAGLREGEYKLSR